MFSRNRIAVVVNLLIVVSMLLGSVAPVLAAAPTEDSIHPIASPSTSELTDTNQTGEIGEDDNSKAEVLAVLDVVGPSVVTPGEEATLAVQILNVGSKPIQKGTLQLREEPGMGLAGRTAYTIPEIPADESVTIEASALVIAKPGDRINARLELVADNLDQEAVGRYQAIVQQGEADTWEPGQGAGLWKPHDRFEIILPEGRDSSIAKIAHRGLYAESAGNPRSLYRFEINAYSEDDKSIERFDTPITFRWHYKEALGDALPIIPPILAWWNPDEEQWVPVPTRVNEVLGIIEADVEHFSTYEYQASVTATAGDTISNLSSDLYSGAMRYSYPMPLLQRPNGFAPSLGLSYSSRRRDHDHGFGSNGSMLGWGWRLDGLGQIDWTLGDNIYKLTLNGATYTINKTASWVWYAEEAPELRITRSSSSQNATWHVRTPDGTHYEFSPLQEVWVCTREYDGGGNPISETPEKKIRTFVLTRITDAADDNAYQYRVDVAYNSDSSIDYTREVDFYCDNSNQLDKEYIFQALPSTMTYYGISAGHSAKAEFSYTTRSDYPEGCNNIDCTNKTDRHLYYYTRALDKVTLKVDTSTARVYDFTSSTVDGRLVLDSVRPLGKGGASDLPPTIFEYDGETNCKFPENCRLNQISNGQGGATSINYVGQTSSQYFIYRVDTIEVQDGFGNTQKC